MVALQGDRVDLDPVAAIDPGDPLVRRVVGLHADGRDDDLAVEHELAARDRLGAAPAGGVGLAERHPLAAQAATAPAASFTTSIGATRKSKTTPSISASSTSTAWAGISSRPRR